MNDAGLREIAALLGDAWHGARPVPAPTIAHPDLTTEDAYAIQELVVAVRIGGGRTRAGWKLGLTSAGPPATPIVGTILSDMVLPSDSILAIPTMAGPMVEAEVVVRLGEDIGRPQTVAELMRGPHEIGAGIEVIDYRTTDSAGPIDWIADNSTVAYAIVGDLHPITDIRPADLHAMLAHDGKVLASGAGSKVMGDPMAAVAWLSTHLLERGHRLARGHVVLTGSLTGHHVVPTDRVSRFTADFGPDGAVSVEFRP